MAQVHKQTVGSGTRIFEKFARDAAHQKYTAIIGLGMTQRGKYMRLEQICHNRFRSKVLAQQPITYKIPSFLAYSKDLRPGNAIGASYCNAICYQIMHLAHPKNFSYIHIPKSLDPITAAQIISKSVHDIT